MTAKLHRPLAVTRTRLPEGDIVVLGNRIRFVDTGPAQGGLAGTAGHREPLVIIPGHTARIEGFDDLVPLLSEHRRVLVLDLPGSGYSDKPDRKYTLELYEDTVMGFLDALGVHRAIPVGGSLGGNLVLRLGHLHPERFPKLVLWAPGSAWKAKPILAQLSRGLGGRLLFWLTVAVQSRFWYSPNFPGRQAALDETFAYYREIMCPGFVRMYWGIAADQLASSLFDIAPQIRQPALLMWGDQDNGAGMAEGVARLASLLPDCKFVAFEGARHSLETEIPQDLAAAINAYLA